MCGPLGQCGNNFGPKKRYRFRGRKSFTYCFFAFRRNIVKSTFEPAASQRNSRQPKVKE